MSTTTTPQQIPATLEFRIKVQDVYTGRLSNGQLAHCMVIVKEQHLREVLPDDLVVKCVAKYPVLKLEEGEVAISYTPLYGSVRAHVGDAVFSCDTKTGALSFFPQYNMYVPDWRGHNTAPQLYFVGGRSGFDKKMVFGQFSNGIISVCDVKVGTSIEDVPKSSYNAKHLIPLRPSSDWISEFTYYDFVNLYRAAQTYAETLEDELRP